jgi:NaMN:DMB phosphoribosyltransferase
MSVKIIVYGTRTEIVEMYLDYVNNFISVGRFADHYDMSEEKANEVIRRGREYHEENVQNYKNSQK